MNNRRETAKFKSSAEGTQIPRFTADQMIAISAPISALNVNSSHADQESELTESEARLCQENEQDLRQENTMLKDQLDSLKQDLMVH